MRTEKVVACIDRLRSLEASGMLRTDEMEVVSTVRSQLEGILEDARATDRAKLWRTIVAEVGRIALWLLLKGWDGYHRHD